jgi:hypothetical protein
VLRCGADDAAACLNDHIWPRLKDPRPAGAPASYRALAPCHDDLTHSLSVSVMDGRRISWNCFACKELLGNEKAQKATRNALILAKVPGICLPQTAPDAADDLEVIRAIIFGKGHRARGWLRIAALLDGYSELPHGDALEALAGSCGVSVAQAYRARAMPTDNQYLP